MHAFFFNFGGTLPNLSSSMFRPSMCTYFFLTSMEDDSGFEAQDTSGVGTMNISAIYNAALSLANETLMTSHLKDSSHKIESFTVLKSCKAEKVATVQTRCPTTLIPARLVCWIKSGKSTRVELSKNNIWVINIFYLTVQKTGLF